MVSIGFLRVIREGVATLMAPSRHHSSSLFTLRLCRLHLFGNVKLPTCSECVSALLQRRLFTSLSLSLLGAQLFWLFQVGFSRRNSLNVLTDGAPVCTLPADPVTHKQLCSPSFCAFLTLLNLSVFYYQPYETFFAFLSFALSLLSIKLSSTFQFRVCWYTLLKSKGSAVVLPACSVHS